MEELTEQPPTEEQTPTSSSPSLDPAALSTADFAAKIRERRPDLGHVSDDLLVQKVVSVKPELAKFWKNPNQSVLDSQRAKFPTQAESDKPVEQTVIENTERDLTPTQLLTTHAKRLAQGLFEGLGIPMTDKRADIVTGTLSNWAHGLLTPLILTKETLTDPAKAQEHLTNILKMPLDMASDLKAGLQGDPEAAGRVISQGAALKEPLEKGYAALKSGLKSSPIPGPTTDQINNLTQITKSGLPNDTAPQTAVPIQHKFATQAAKELGVNPQTDILTSGKPDELYDGVTALKKAEIANRVGKTSAQLKPIPVEIADRMVNVAHRPISHAVAQASEVEMPAAAKQSIIDDLAKQADNQHGVDDALERAIWTKINNVRSAKTYSDFDQLKINANKETSRLGGKSPSAQIAATATPIYAYRLLGDSIRDHMYPALEQELGMDKDTLINAGREETSAIHGRDGLYDSHSTAAENQTQVPQSMRAYLNYVFRGKAYPAGETPPSPESGSISSTVIKPIKRAVVGAAALGGVDTPLADFNTRLRNALGDVTPNTQRLLLNGPNPASTMIGRGTDTSAIKVSPAETIPTHRYERFPLTGNARLLPAAGETSIKVTPPPVESFADTLKRNQTPQSRIMREITSKGPFGTQDRPATPEEYTATKGGREMFEVGDKRIFNGKLYIYTKTGWDRVQ